MLNHSFWPARALPAACLPPRCPACATFAQQCLFAARQGHGLLFITISIKFTILPPCPRALLEFVVAARAGRGVRRKQGEPGPELARHVLVEALVLFPVKVLVILGEARVQRFPRVCRLEVGCCTHQGFNVGHKVLGDIQGLGKSNGVLGGLAGWEIRRDERLDVVHGFWGKAPHALLVAYRGKDLSEKRKLHP